MPAPPTQRTRSTTPGFTAELPIAPKGKALAAGVIVIGLTLLIAKPTALTMILALLCFALGARVAFGMTVRADETGVRIPRLLRTVHLPSEDLMGVQYVGRRLATNNSKATNSTLMIFGRNYEVFALPLHERNPGRAPEFAQQIEDLFALAPGPEERDSFETARRLHQRRSRQELELVRSVGIALGLVLAGAHFTSRVLLGTSPIWALPLCVAIFGCAAWFGRRYWESYSTRVDWDFYW